MSTYNKHTVLTDRNKMDASLYSNASEYEQLLVEQKAKVSIGFIYEF